MSRKKIGVIVAAGVIAVAAVIGGIWYFGKGNSGSGKSADKVFVQKVSEIDQWNTGVNSSYSGIVESQETWDVNKDTERQVKEVDYGTFMDMIDDGKIGKVEIEDNQIVFTNKDEDKIYKTGVMEDPTLTERLHKSGAEFTKEIDTTMSPLMSTLLTVFLPLLIFVLLGQYMSKKLIEQAGGKNALSFGMGKSNADG